MGPSIMGPNPPKPNKHKNTKALKVYHENVDELSLAFLLAQMYRKFNWVWATHRCHNVMASEVKLAGSRKICSIVNKILPPLKDVLSQIVFFVKHLPPYVFTRI